MGIEGPELADQGFQDRVSTCRLVQRAVGGFSPGIYNVVSLSCVSAPKPTQHLMNLQACSSGSSDLERLNSQA